MAALHQQNESKCGISNPAQEDVVVSILARFWGLLQSITSNQQNLVALNESHPSCEQPSVNLWDNRLKEREWNWLS